MKVLIVDAMPLAYKTFAAVGHLSTSSGVPTGMRFGFLRSLNSWAKLFALNEVIICWDTPHPIKKAAGVETYKADREITESKKTMFSQLADLKAMLALTKYDQVEAPGYEADDLCATLARIEEAKGNSVTIATVDRDLFSVVSDNVKVLHTSGANSLIDPLMVVSEFDCVPHLVPAHKAVLGDVSDNIAPLIGGHIADAFKMKLKNRPDLTSEQLISDFWSQLDSLDLEKAFSNLRMTSLCDVPEHDMTFTRGTSDVDGLTSMFQKLEFKSMMAHIQLLTDKNFIHSPTKGKSKK